MVEGICDEQISVVIDKKSRREVQLCQGGWATVAAESGGPVSGHSRDHPGRGFHLADSVVEAVSDVEIALQVDLNCIGCVEGNAGSRSTFRTCSSLSGPSNQEQVLS